MPNHYPNAYRVVINIRNRNQRSYIEEKETNIPNLEQRLLAQQSAAGSKKGEKKKDAVKIKIG